jgi:uncharacterized protein
MERSHKVDVSGILAGGRQLMLVEDEVPLEPFEGLVFPQPVRVRLELRRGDRMLVVEGSLEADISGLCDACLAAVHLEMRLEVDERLDPSHGRDVDPYGESNVLTGDRLDVADLAQQSVLSALPMGLRCSAECRGLCPTCGANRNTSECSCESA